MFSPPHDAFVDRRQTANAARAALIAKLKPKAAVPAAQPIDRVAERASRLVQVRLDRAHAKSKRRDAAEATAAAAVQANADLEAAALELKRGARRERKALTAAEAKTKRDERAAARRARAR